jgi:hypothetical protein
MKKVYLFLSLSLTLISILSCKKDEYQLRNTASVMIVNAAIANGNIKANVGADNTFLFAKAIEIPYGSSGLYGTYMGVQNINIMSSTDSTKSFYRKTMSLKPLSTIYICGQNPIIDTIFTIEDNLPSIYSGSVTNPENALYLRFINLSPNSPPLNINIRTVTSNEITGLAYKATSTFKKYEALTTTANYIFEIRDSQTNIVQTTFTLITNSNRFKTISLIIRGTYGVTTGANAFGISQINYTG